MTRGVLLARSPEPCYVQVVHDSGPGDVGWINSSTCIDVANLI